MRESILIAQASDPHVTVPGVLMGGRVDTSALFARCVERLAALDPPPDLVILSGDLANTGKPEEYQHLRRLLTGFQLPFRLMVGNHDDRDALRDAFPEHAYLREDPRYVHCAFDAGPLRVLLLDTLDPGRDAGTLDAARLAWLAAQLDAEPRVPTLVFMHHPPFATGLAAMDAMRCDHADELERLVRRHGQVHVVACGHVHRPVVTRWAGALAMTAPSTAHQIDLDLGADAPPRYTLEPPAFLLHRWSAGRLVTHVCPVGPFPGPYGF
ncbi:MAG TPA: phosphodiesterase [Pelomicrobium sp.]|nr:phosphodiesterase [Pelomicrobium sp.]